MRDGGRTRRRRTVALAVVAPLALVALSGCEVKDSGENLVAGKKAFVQKCGSCHTLRRAETTGTSGPNLDEAFRQARTEGFGESTFEGIVRQQILYPLPRPQRDPSGREAAIMPANLVQGELAEDVAAYVASVAARPGKDTGALAEAVPSGGSEKKVAVAEGGQLEIPADPNGRLVYEFGGARAKPGTITLLSPNESAVPHNIAVEGSGLDEKGPVVERGGVSKLEVKLARGQYTFYCSVPGHREGGMLGKLEVR